MHSICERCEHRRGGGCAVDGKGFDGRSNCVLGLATFANGKPGVVGLVGSTLPDTTLTGWKPIPRRTTAGGGHPTGPRVGFVYPCWQSLGGVERHTLTLIGNCPGVTWSGLVAMNPDMTNHEAICRLGQIIPTYGPGGLQTLLASSDILVVWGFTGSLDWLRDYRGKVVSITHGEGDWSARQVRAVLPYADRHVAVCESAVKQFPEDLRPRVNVILNGIQFDRLGPTGSRAEIRARLGIDQDAFVVGSVGRISEEKNPLAAAQAVAEIVQDDPSSRAIALYVGDHGTRSVAEEFMGRARRIAPGRVKWIREVDHERIGDYYRAMDVFVMASEREGGPLVSGEAWFCGVPQVATPVGMIPALESRFGQLTWRVPLRPTASQLALAVRAAAGGGDRVTLARDVVINELGVGRFGGQWGRLLRGMTGE